MSRDEGEFEEQGMSVTALNRDEFARAVRAISRGGTEL